MLIFYLPFIALITSSGLTVKSPSFQNNNFIPAKFTCDGAGVNPELDIADLPANTKSIALIVDDPDAPSGTFDHWVMWNIPVTTIIKENSTPGIQGKNGKKENNYAGPCPPEGTHHYHFEIYALDTVLDLPSTTDRLLLEKAMESHVINFGELIGLYKREQKSESEK
jgi:Raf kinase inhibitor-like YbhB/YbcL family protein